MEYYSPGGGLPRLERDLTDEEKNEYLLFLQSKGLTTDLRNIVVVDGVVRISNIWKLPPDHPPIPPDLP